VTAFRTHHDGWQRAADRHWQALTQA
jgi:hypothetical protein